MATKTERRKTSFFINLIVVTLKTKKKGVITTAKPHYKRVVVSNHVVEIYTYEKQQWSGYEQDEKEGRRSAEECMERSWSSTQRSRQMIRRLILANFNNDSKFVTLTFKENLTDLEEANKRFKRFIQRLRYKYQSFKYLAVIEFQERGAVHYHMISDLPYIKNKELAEIWNEGFVKITNITHVDNVGAYMIKYMVKDLTDKRLSRRKVYQCSKGLDKPYEARGEEAERIIQAYDLEKRKPVFSSSYEGEYTGQVDYMEYNLRR